MRKHSGASRTAKRTLAGGTVLALAALFGLPGTALAAPGDTVVSFAGVTLTVQADAGEANVITVAGSSTITIKDTGSDVVIPNASAQAEGCAQTANDNQTNCPIGAIEQIVINGDDLNDTVFVLTTAAGVTVNGGNGDDNLRGGGGEDNLNGGNGDDTLVGGNGGDNLDGGTSLGDADLVDYGAKNDPVTVTLDSGIDNDGEAGELDDVTNVENVDGGDDNDTLTGNASNNTLVGGPGNDTMNGGAGDDTLEGESGNDTYNGGSGGEIAGDKVTYGTENDDVVVTQDGVANDGVPGDETDNVGSDIEILVGGSGDDTITGAAGSSQTVNGASGNDVLSGGAGAAVSDTIVGGSGTDTASYAERTANVNASLDGLNNDGESGEGDNIQSGVESLLGGDGNDVLTGSDGVNRLNGGAGADDLFGEGGNDTLVGLVSAAADVLDGGAGSDTATYASDVAGVTITIDGTANDAGNDQVRTDIENVTGGDGIDSLTGSAANNKLNGGLGGDTLNGLAGNDVLNGGDGNDTLNGGDGNDVLNGQEGGDAMHGDLGNADSVSYTGETRDVRAFVGDGANDGADQDTGTPGIQDEGDNIFGDVEKITGGSGDDLLKGDTGNDTLNGGSGNDDLNGLQGNDVLSGQGGNDDILGHSGRDTLSGSTGNDFLDSDTSDSAADSDTCGDGVDDVDRDSLDNVSANCENLS